MPWWMEMATRRNPPRRFRERYATFDCPRHSNTVSRSTHSINFLLIFFQGHRLGAANETQAPASTSQTANDVDDTLPPRKDPNISDSDRDKQREARLAAAEARQKKMGGPPKKEKKTTGPLRGPNTEYTMTWQAG
jgi:hypothetical protein